MLAMPGDIRGMGRHEPGDAQWPLEAENVLGRCVESRRYGDDAVLADTDEARVEGRIEMGGEQEPIVHVEPLGVAVAVRPWLRMARPQQLGNGETSDGASTLPEIDEAGAEDVLSDALDHNPLGLGGGRKPPCTLPEGVERSGGERARELEGTLQQPMESRQVQCLEST